jgi:hypothetical protein
MSRGTSTRGNLVEREVLLNRAPETTFEKGMLTHAFPTRELPTRLRLRYPGCLWESWSVPLVKVESALIIISSKAPG